MCVGGLKYAHVPIFHFTSFAFRFRSVHFAFCFLLYAPCTDSRAMYYSAGTMHLEWCEKNENPPIHCGCVCVCVCVVYGWIRMKLQLSVFLWATFPFVWCKSNLLNAPLPTELTAVLSVTRKQYKLAAVPKSGSERASESDTRDEWCAHLMQSE